MNWFIKVWGSGSQTAEAYYNAGVNASMAQYGVDGGKVNNYLQLENDYSGEGEVIHYLEMLRDEIGFDKIAEKVVKPLNRKIAAYYGCMLLKPKKAMNFDDPENPS